MTYWEKRRHLAYYRTAVDYVRSYATAGTLLDVGSGIQFGCRYLEWLPEFNRTSIELCDDAGTRLDGVRSIFGDFLAWQPDRTYDVALCLQVIEHVPDAKLFTEKLFDFARTVVLSVPYQWPNGCCKQHVHDPIDESKLQSWTGRVPDRSEIVGDGRGRDRLVAVYAAQPR